MAFRMEYEEGEMPEAPRREVLDGVLVGLVGLVTLVLSRPDWAGCCRRCFASEALHNKRRNSVGFLCRSKSLYRRWFCTKASDRRPVTDGSRINCAVAGPLLCNVRITPKASAGERHRRQGSPAVAR